jgi:phosphoribosylformylglycinamidine synthase
LPPELDLKAERALQRLLVDSARQGLMRSAHDCAEGGLAVTLAECTFGTNGIGVEVDLNSVPGASSWSSVSALFSESASRAVVSVAPAQAAAFQKFAEALGVPARKIGTVGGARIRISIEGLVVVDLSVAECESIWDSALERYFRRQAA